MNNNTITLTKEEAAIAGALLAIASGVMADRKIEDDSMQRVIRFAGKACDVFPEAQESLLEKFAPEKCFGSVLNQIKKELQNE